MKNEQTLNMLVQILIIKNGNIVFHIIKGERDIHVCWLYYYKQYFIVII